MKMVYIENMVVDMDKVDAIHHYKDTLTLYLGVHAIEVSKDKFSDEITIMRSMVVERLFMEIKEGNLTCRKIDFHDIEDLLKSIETDTKIICDGKEYSLVSIKDKVVNLAVVLDSRAQEYSVKMNELIKRIVNKALEEYVSREKDNENNK